MGLQGSALTVGAALGAPLAGVVIDASGPVAAFVTVGVLGVVLAGAGGLIARSPTRSPPPSRDVKVGHTGRQ
jgi:hypothetical protein